MFASKLKKLFSVLHLVIGKTKSVARAKQAAQQFLAFRKRRVAQVVAVAEKQVEQVVGHSGLRKERWGRRAHVHPFLQGLEIAMPARIQNDDAMPARIQNDDFAIQNCTRRAHTLGKSGQLRILLCDVATGARTQFQLPVFDPRQRSNAVPFDFEEPIGVGERTADGRC